MVGGGVLLQAAAVDCAFEIERAYREAASDFPKMYAGDPDAHPAEDGQVVHGRGAWTVATADRAALDSQQRMTLKLRWTEDGWRIVRWIDVPTACGEKGGI